MQITTAGTADRLTCWKFEVNGSWLCIEQHPNLAVVWVAHPITHVLLLTAEKLHDYQARDLQTRFVICFTVKPSCSGVYLTVALLNLLLNVASHK